MTLYSLSVHLFVFGLTAMLAAPLGITVKSMLCTLVVSMLMNTMVVPGATVSEFGIKFSAVFEPMPLGSVTLTEGPDEDVEGVLVLVTVETVELLVGLLLVVVVLELLLVDVELVVVLGVTVIVPFIQLW